MTEIKDIDVESYRLGFSDGLDLKHGSYCTYLGYSINDIIETMSEKYRLEAESELEQNLNKWYGQEEKPVKFIKASQCEIDKVIVNNSLGIFLPMSIINALNKNGLIICREVK